jgi:hypothetical protein
MSSLDNAVLTQILNQLASLQLSQQVLQAKVVWSFLPFVSNRGAKTSAIV